MARLEMTSLAFMLVCVPLPVCQMRRGNYRQFAGDYFVCSLVISLALSAKVAEILIHQRRRFFQDAESADEFGGIISPHIEVDQREQFVQ